MNSSNFEDNSLLKKRIDQAINKYQKTSINIALNFLSADKLKDAQYYLGNKIDYQLLGGYTDALSKRLVIGQNIEPNQYISCLRAKFNNKYNKITHRDVSGALYGLQIQRDRFGDLWVDEDNIYLYCEKELENYLCQNFTQISRANVKFEPVSFATQIFKFEEFRFNVTSLRLDNIVSDIVHKSREKTKQYIHQDMVKVNYNTIEDCDYLCNNGDTLSLSTIGRFLIDNIDVNNRTGKYIVSIKKYK